VTRRRIVVLAAGLAAGLGGAALLWPIRRVPDAAALLARADQLGGAHGILIGYGALGSFFVPPFTAQDAVIPNGRATRVDLDALPRALDGIAESLAVYPRGFVAARCKAIFVCGSLTLDGAEAGGTYGPAWIILVATRRVGDAGIFETARLGVHHELSSLVWNARPDLPARWRAELPAGWTDAPDNAAALASGQPGAADLDRGFLSPYGATTAENDFNVYAELAFTEPQRVADLAASRPLVARKLALLIDAYTASDARLADVFARLGLARFAASAKPAPAR
jgi:hypothetical protein